MAGIIEYIRTKFGSPEEPDSAALQRALDDLGERIEKNQQATAALEAELPTAVIRSIDAGATERRKLAGLRSELAALQATATVIRTQLADIRAHEAAAQLAAHWERAQLAGDAVLDAAQRVEGAVDVLADELTKLFGAAEDFERSLPTKAPDFQGTRLIRKNLSAILDARLILATRGQVRIGGQLSMTMAEMGPVAEVVKQIESWVAPAIRIQPPSPKREPAPATSPAPQEA